MFNMSKMGKVTIARQTWIWIVVVFFRTIKGEKMLCILVLSFNVIYNSDFG